MGSTLTFEADVSSERSEDFIDLGEERIPERTSSLTSDDYDLTPIKRTFAQKGLRFFSEEETKIYKLKTDAIFQKKISRERSEKQRSLRRTRARDFLSQARGAF